MGRATGTSMNQRNPTRISVGFRLTTNRGVRRLAGMTTARRLLVAPDVPGFYHCVSRCVRRAWLCGLDPLTGRSFEHRRDWIEDRLHELAGIFAVGVYAYAVMSNHVHVVLRIDPTAAAGWSDEEVAQRWVRLFPARQVGNLDEDACRQKERTILGNAERVQQCRARLGSLSWFMRALNEPIARRANGEDSCTGRFWEGRYKCQALLDETAVLACMSYVDLNPIRAGLCDELSQSAHTSVVRRIEALRAEPEQAARSIAPVAASVPAPALSIRIDEYLVLIDWTGRQVRGDQRGAIRADVPPTLARLGLDFAQWQAQVLGIESRYWRAVGRMQALVQRAAELGQRWLKGVRLAPQ